MPSPTVVIVSYGRPDLLAECLASLRTHASTLPVHVWDNCSPETPAVRALSSSWPEVTWTFHDENIGFAAAVNRLASQAPGDLLLLNPDAELLGHPEQLVAVLEGDERAAAAGPFVAVSGLRPWDNARRLPGPLRMIVEYVGWSDRLRGTPLSQRYRRAPWAAGYVSGACLLIRRTAWEDVGAFDERFWLYSEEVDWARRAKQRGWRIRVVPELLASHEGGASSARPSAPEVPGSQGAPQPAVAHTWLFDMQVAYLAKHYGRLASSSYRVVAGLYDRLRRARARRR